MPTDPMVALGIGFALNLLLTIASKGSEDMSFSKVQPPH